MVDVPPGPYERLPGWLDDASGLHIAVVGADGFIGSALVRAALAASAHVTAVCLKNPWRLANVDDQRVRIERAPEEWWTADFARDFRRVAAAADAVAILAYRPPPDGSREARAAHELAVNAEGARRLAEAACTAGRPVAFASSADVYGAVHEAPVDESVDPAPETAYAQAKLRAEHLLAECREASSVSLRIATVFGPGEHGPRAIPSFIRAFSQGRAPIVHGDGADVRDYVYVGDVGGAFVNACVRSTQGRADEVVNIGSGVGRTTLEVLHAVAGVLGVQPEVQRAPRPRPPSRLVLAVDRARRALGMEPRPDFETAIGEEANWLRRAVS